MKQFFPPRMIAALAAALLPASAFACATCGCSLSTDAALGYSSAPGWRASLQFDAIDQNQLRSGSSAVPLTRAAAANDAGGSQEVEQRTINRYLTLGLDYAPNASWDIALRVPYVSRSHTTYGNAGAGQLDQADVSGAQVSGVGDIRIVGSWQGLLPTHALGLQLGVKLPTGSYGGPNADGSGVVGRSPTAFSTGPNAAQPAPGNLLDTSLQAGNGSTDLIVGAYDTQPVSQDFDAFVSGQFQVAVAHALDQPGQDYRPGNQANVSFGLRDERNPDLVPQLQINISHRSADQGALADRGDTEGTVVYLSPGMSLSLARAVQLYGFVQLPLYSRLDGYQLFPHWTATAGVSYAF